MNKRFWIVLFIDFLVGCGWYWIGRAMVLRAGQNEWLSSFIEISIALNSAISFQKVRDWINPMRAIFEYRVKKVARQYKDKIQISFFQYVRAHADEVFDSCSDMMRRDLSWVVNLARIVATGSILILLSYRDGDCVTYIPCLILPFVFYQIGTFFEMFTIVEAIDKLFNEACEVNGVKLKVNIWRLS